ncbi:MAG: hypothetical protein Q9169_007393 [Polycauliona sp. 2 TL-2023]
MKLPIRQALGNRGREQQDTTSNKDNEGHEKSANDVNATSEPLFQSFGRTSPSQMDIENAEELEYDNLPQLTPTANHSTPFFIEEEAGFHTEMVESSGLLFDGIPAIFADADDDAWLNGDEMNTDEEMARIERETGMFGFEEMTQQGTGTFGFEEMMERETTEMFAEMIEQETGIFGFGEMTEEEWSKVLNGSVEQEVLGNIADGGEGDEDEDDDDDKENVDPVNGLAWGRTM